MTKKLDADAITTAIHQLEENTRKATLIEIRDELLIAIKQAAGTNPEHIPGLEAFAEFMTNNYGL